MARQAAVILKRRQILESLVRGLKEFGYPSVTAENIITDYVYREFAIPQLKEVLELQPFQFEVKQLLTDMEHAAAAEIVAKTKDLK